jgi:SAM-dependent methyltransferase
MRVASLPCSTSALSSLPDRLSSLGYAEATIRELLRTPAPSPLPPVGHAPSVIRAACSGDGPTGLLTRLLLLGDPISIEEMSNLPERLVTDLADANLVTTTPGGLRPAMRLTPFHGLFLAGDLHNEGSAHVEFDAVENPHGPTEALSRLIPRENVDHSLDIGTGSGVHAFQAAAHSRSVVGVDVSPRAVAFAQFNAMLNNITNVRFQTGDVAHGLGSQRFDLIVSNPPYLLSPESGILYRDGNEGSGHVGTRVLDEAPVLLAPGGLLVCLSSWGVTECSDPDREIRALAQRAGCDALTLVYAVHTPLENAIRWNVQRHDAQELREAARAWTAFYLEHSVEKIAYGMVVFTPATGHTPWFHSETISLAGQDLDRGQLRDIIHALDQRAGDEVPSRLRLHTDHAVDSVARIADRETIVGEQFLRSTRGIRFTVSCGPRLLAAVAGGTRPEPQEPGGLVIADMLTRLYELGFLIDDRERDL